MYFDIIVIGGGHAGIEAIFVSTKIVKKVLLITFSKKNIGEMSCNPSIGGIGKSHLVKEIDALGGLMGKVADLSGIHFKILNSSKGDAVKSTRIQVDKEIYKKKTLDILNKIKNLIIYEDEVINLIIKKNKVIGVKTKKRSIYSKVVILSTGTFLNSKIFIGKKIYKGGRLNDNYSELLAENLIKYPFKYGYLKTGTPPRIKYDSVKLDNLKKQYSENIKGFSFLEMYKKKNKLKKVNCYLTYTNNLTHKIIKNNIKSSPLYNGIIKSIGPRYCPSLEDKVINFSDKKKHNIFLEQENLFKDIIYPNGISNSFPIEIQNKIVKSIKGMEYSIILKPGYAVEYLYIDPKDLYKSLESKIIKNLFLAGQINGTTGYEEAASQGIVAGINASLKVNNKNIRFIPNRENSYMGVLIDDLCIKGINEPYRMFTSRSEYRLFLREDNADYRLTPIGYKLGLINNKRWYIFKKKMSLIKENYNFLKDKEIFIEKIFKKIKYKNIFNNSNKIKIKSIISNYGISLKEIIHLFKKKIKNKFLKEVEILIKYKGYLDKQKVEINKLSFYKKTIIPNDIDYNKICNLSKEIIQKLSKYKPKCLYDAYMISGVTPSSIINIYIYIKKNYKIDIYKYY